MGWFFGGFALFIVLIVLLSIAGLVVNILGLIDAARRPEGAFKAAGTDRTLWVVLMAVGLAVTGLGPISAIVYYASYRKRIIQAELWLASTGGFYGHIYPSAYGGSGPQPWASPGVAWAHSGGIPTAPSPVPGWHPDPARRHEVRFHDGTSWSGQVRDNGVVSDDPL